jgi:hypothetical protein
MALSLARGGVRRLDNLPMPKAQSSNPRQLSRTLVNVEGAPHWGARRLYQPRSENIRRGPLDARKPDGIFVPPVGMSRETTSYPNGTGPLYEPDLLPLPTVVLLSSNLPR